MKVRKSYQKDKVQVCALEGDMLMVMRFDNEQQMSRLGECLKDLARTGAKEVDIIPKEDLPPTNPYFHSNDFDDLDEL